MRGVSNRRIIPYDRRWDECIPPVTLSLSNLTYANASPRYIWFNGILTGPFAAGIPATRWIGGRRYIQIEKAIIQSILYSDRLDDAWWNFAGIGDAIVTPNDAISPLGDMTACRMTTGATTADCYRHGTGLTGTEGVISAFVKAGTQGTKLCLRLNTVGTSDYNITPPLNWTRYQVYRIDTDPYPVVYNCWNANAFTDWATGDNHLLYCVQVEMGEHYAHSPIINNTGSPLVKVKDEAYFATADVPAWMRDGFTLYAYPEFSSAELAADTGIRYLATLDTTAEVIEIYLDAGGNIVVVGSVSGLFVQAAGLTWSAYQRLKISIEYNNGSNSVLTTSGFTTGDAVTNGVAFSGAGGPVYLGMTKLLAGQWDGLLSEPEPL